MAAPRCTLPGSPNSFVIGASRRRDAASRVAMRPVESGAGARMPVVREVADGILTLRMQGEYTPQDIRAAFLAVDGDGAIVGMVFDVSESAVLPTRSTTDIRDMGAFLGRVGARYGRRLALVGASDVAYGLMRLASVSVPETQAETETFRDVGAARAWLLR